MLKKTQLLAIISILVICLSFGNTVYGISGLTVSPLRTEFDIAPGTVANGVLTVKNSTSASITVNFNADEFSVIDQQYDYAFTEDSEVADWVSFSLSEVILLAGEAKEVLYSISVPLSAEPGGRYVSLFSSTNTNSDNLNIISKQRVASLLYITVTGDVTREGHLISLTSPWAIGGESAWSVAIQNTGTTHFRSGYNLSIKNIFGNSTVASMTGNALILPGSIRLVSDTLPTPKYPGIYKIVYNIGLGDTPAEVETRYILYLSPLAFMILISIIVIATVWLTRRKKSRKKAN